MRLVLCALVAALALPAMAQTRARQDIQAELDALSAQKQQLLLSLNVADNKIMQLRTQRTQKDAGAPFHTTQVGAGETPETNAAIIDQASRSGRDTYDEAIDQAQNQKSQIQRRLLKVEQQIDKDKA